MRSAGKRVQVSRDWFSWFYFWLDEKMAWVFFSQSCSEVTQNQLLFNSQMKAVIITQTLSQYSLSWLSHSNAVTSPQPDLIIFSITSLACTSIVTRATIFCRWILVRLPRIISENLFNMEICKQNDGSWKEYSSCFVKELLSSLRATKQDKKARWRQLFSWPWQQIRGREQREWEGKTKKKKIGRWSGEGPATLLSRTPE